MADLVGSFKLVKWLLLLLLLLADGTVVGRML